MSKNRLGKGLSALIADNQEESSSDSKVIDIYVENIEPNPFQPRQEFDQESLEELGRSIEKNGMIQPVSVRQAEPDKYQLAVGERRWRAARMMGVNKIPGIVREFSDMQMVEIALIENLQREDLNPIEEAQAYHKMINKFDMTQAEVARKIGKSRSAVANFVRLLNLAPKVQVYVSRETLSMGHARTLLAIKNNDLQIEIADHVIKNELSVRETEKHVAAIKKKKGKDREDETESRQQERKQPQLKLDPRWINAGKKLSRSLGIDVEIKKRKNKKVVIIECEEYEDIEKLLSRINTG